MLIDGDRLEAFVAFADAGSFTHAARALHVTQPALFAQIKKLSEELELTLYLRRGRKLELTAQGEALARFGREQLSRTAGFLDEVRFGASRQPVVLAAGEGAYLYLLGDAIRSFVKTAVAPLSLLTRDRDGTLEALRSGTAHLGVAPLGSLPPDLEGAVLAEVGTMAVLPPKHRLAKKRRLTPRDLDGERLILPPRGRPHREAVEAALAEAGVAAQVPVEAHGWETMIHFVRLELGIAVVNRFVRVPAKLIARPLSGIPAKSYWLLHRRGLAHHGAAELMRALKS
jgi:LysR family transcriptional regulator, low CO2-responsive transcriptional regulator